MLTFCWTVCSWEKVTGFPVWSVSMRAPSLTRTLTWSVICMAVPLSRGGVDALERCRDVYAVDAQGQGPSRVEKSRRVARLFMSINVTMLDRERRGGKAPTCCAITRYTSGKGHLPLDQSAMPPKGIMVTIRIGGEELLMEEILFSLKHYWRFVDSEALDLKALSWGVDEKAA